MYSADGRRLLGAFRCGSATTGTIRTSTKEISPHYYAGQFQHPGVDHSRAEPDFTRSGRPGVRVIPHPANHRGVESKLVYYPDENHWILKPNNSIHWYHTVREWVERHAEPGGR